MRKFVTYSIEKPNDFKFNLLSWASRFESVCYLNSNTLSNNSSKNYSNFECLVAVDSVDEIIVPACRLRLPQATMSSEGRSRGEGRNTKGAFTSLKNSHNSKDDWLFGFFSYDLKNEVEDLTSENFDGIKMPGLHFFQPKFIFIIKGDGVRIGYLEEFSAKEELNTLFEQINITKFEVQSSEFDIGLKSRITKEQYLASVHKLKEHIKYGNIYEVNFCQEFYAEEAKIDPLQTYLHLNEISQSPFSCFYRLNDKYLICASPERFIKKTGQKLISQPIKGTIKRGATRREDEKLMEDLLNNPKERSENVMIVDLVRNDLSRTAKKGSVEVEELYGIYSFKQVHQMISTVSSELRDDVHFVNAIQNAFPMGSMTGAPKIRAMELIEQYESTKRGLYSGAVGYITPEGDFDFNVVIRSILYNSTEKYVSFMVGGAITDKSLPEKEYEECLLKAKAMFEVLDPKIGELTD